MKKIEAIIRHIKTEDVRHALLEAGATGMTLTEIKGLGGQEGHYELYRGEKYYVDFLPKIKLEVLVAEDVLEACLQAIMDAARTGIIGDGKIFVTPVEQVLRIRTGERDESAM